jgi:hypothetical protein
MYGREQLWMVPVKAVQPFGGTVDLLDGCHNIKEAKHWAITPNDIKEVMTAINKKYLISPFSSFTQMT